MHEKAATSCMQNREMESTSGWQFEENDHPIEEVRLTVDPSDNPNLPALTFRTWLLGVGSCVLLSFTNTFFGYRTNQLQIGSVCVLIFSLPIGRFLAATLPSKMVKVPFTKWSFSLNPGPFSIKEHCLVSIFAGAGSGSPMAVAIITIVQAFYHRKINLVAAFLLVQTTQLLGYGLAGVFKQYLVDSPYMWWPGNLVHVSLFKALNHKEERKKGTVTRFQFFITILVASFAYYVIPGFLFPAISTISILCVAFRGSVTMQQIGSGLHGLGVGSIGLDWATVAGFLGSPLASPASAIFNTMISFFLFAYVLLPLGYWTNIYNAKRFPLISSSIFDSSGKLYNTTRITDDNAFTLNVQEQERYGKANMSISFALNYALSFASLTASFTHVALHNGRDIWRMWKNTKRHAKEAAEDVHTRLMKRNYKPVPQWWFYAMLFLVIGLSIFACVGFDGQLQLPWWGVLFAIGLALFFTLPIGVILATTNQWHGIGVITEYIIGLILPGKPVANVTCKTYGTLSMGSAIYLLSDLNLGHYMKIPPKSMFVTQLVGTMINSTVSFGTACLLLDSIPNICDPKKLPSGSPWTCPNYQVFYNASVIWGLVGPMRIFGKLGHYSALNSFFLIGLLLPIPFWLLSKALPKCKWLQYIHIPLLLSGGARVPPTHSVNFIMWGTVGIFFNYYIYNRHKGWWSRHAYVMSAGLDAGVAFMGVLIFFALQLNRTISMDWWGGVADDYCPLASCPTASGVVVNGCPIRQ